jgi:hypothetical protein
MTKLSDTQAILLAAAARRPDGDLLPLPFSLRGGAAAKVVGALLARGLIREEPIDASAEGGDAPDRVWRTAPDGRAMVLRITAAGGPAPAQQPGETPAGPQTAEVPTAAPRPPRARRAAPAGAEAAAGPRTRGDSKQALLIALHALQRRRVAAHRLAAEERRGASADLRLGRQRPANDHEQRDLAPQVEPGHRVEMGRLDAGDRCEGPLAVGVGHHQRPFSGEPRPSRGRALRSDGRGDRQDRPGPGLPDSRHAAA